MFGRDEDVFLENDIFQKSCAFSILQIGELVKSLSPELKARYGQIHWKGIAGTRDVIVHNYGKIQHGDVWIMMTEDIPELKDVCERMLSELE